MYDDDYIADIRANLGIIYAMSDDYAEGCAHLEEFFDEQDWFVAKQLLEDMFPVTPEDWDEDTLSVDEAAYHGII